MKTAIIYFEGREVCRVEFDMITRFNGIEFSLEVPTEDGYELEVVAEFPRDYGYTVLKDISEEEKQGAIEIGKNAAKGIL